jgi:RNA polymerase sigma-70 factor (ECF subfamily)
MSKHMRSLSEPNLEAPPDPAGDDLIEESPALDVDGRHFSRFVQAQLEWVWRVLRRTGLSAADADDATQQVFLVAARRIDQVQGSRARPFLYGTAIRVAANVRRSLRRRRETASELSGSVAASQPATDELLEQRRARAFLDELLARLPDELRRVLVLAEIEELTARQIAELEAIPPGTAASRLRRARAAFVLLLEQESHNNPYDRRGQ